MTTLNVRHKQAFRSLCWILAICYRNTDYASLRARLKDTPARGLNTGFCKTAVLNLKVIEDQMGFDVVDKEKVRQRAASNGGRGVSGGE